MEALRSVAGQTVPVEEVVVVDGTAQKADETELAAALAGGPRPPRLVYCWAPGDKGLPAARNRGVAASQGELILFMDDDTTIAPDYFQHLAQVFAPAEVGGAAGRIIDAAAESHALRRLFFRLCYIGPFRQRTMELYLRLPDAPAPTDTLPGASAYRREVFSRFHFDEALTGPAVGEDLDFSYRVGKAWRLMIQPAARMVHHRSPHERQDSRRNFADKVCFYHYHFRKNMRGTLSEWAAFLWLNFGFLMDALIRLRAEPLRGVLDGWGRIAGRGLLWRP